MKYLIMFMLVITAPFALADDQHTTISRLSLSHINFTQSVYCDAIIGVTLTSSLNAEKDTVFDIAAQHLNHDEADQLVFDIDIRHSHLVVNTKRRQDHKQKGFTLPMARIENIIIASGNFGNMTVTLNAATGLGTWTSFAPNLNSLGNPIVLSQYLTCSNIQRHYL
jgi:hypothetical protein